MKIELREVEDDVVVIDTNGLAMFIQSTPVLNITPFQRHYILSLVPFLRT